MGHLTEIANSLQAVAARRPAVARTLCSNAAWTDFAFGPLAERNQVASHFLHCHTIQQLCMIVQSAFDESVTGACVLCAKVAEEFFFASEDST